MGLLFSLVLALSLGFLFELGLFLKAKIELSSHCTYRVLRLQNQLKKPLEALIRLNPKAEKLRARKKLAQLKLTAAMASGNPPLIAKFKAELTVIHHLQLALALKQQSHLMLAKTLRQNFASHISGQKYAFRKIKFIGESSGLALDATPTGDITPNYNPSLNFRKAQAQSYGVAKEILKVRLSHFCSATLEKEKHLWVPRLKPAKANWR